MACFCRWSYGSCALINSPWCLTYVLLVLPIRTCRFKVEIPLSVCSLGSSFSAIHVMSCTWKIFTIPPSAMDHSSERKRGKPRRLMADGSASRQRTATHDQLENRRPGSGWALHQLLAKFPGASSGLETPPWHTPI
jgi:hypothetical protein